MTPSRLVEALAMLVEETSPRIYDRDSGNEQPIQNKQLLVIRERINTLIAMNLRKEEK